MNFITGLSQSASALDAERTRLETVSSNIANAHTTHSADGTPYHRRVVSFQSMMDSQHAGAAGVQVNQIATDKTPGERIYQPGHPDADKNGFVEMPNVNLAYEMVDLMSASRAYEANLAVVQNSRQLANRALSIGK